MSNNLVYVGVCKVFGMCCLNRGLRGLRGGRGGRGVCKVFGMCVV